MVCYFNTEKGCVFDTKTGGNFDTEKQFFVTEKTFLCH